MKKLLLACLSILLLAGCSKTYESWDFPISLNSTEADVKEVFGYPEEDTFISNRATYWYKSDGISVAFDTDKNVVGINFRGNQNMEDWSSYDGQILNGVLLSMSINEVINRLGKEYETDDSFKDIGTIDYIWHMDGMDVVFEVWYEDYVKDDVTYPQDSVAWLTISKTLTNRQKEQAENTVKDFYSKYSVLHKNELFGKELYLNSEKIGDFGTTNVFSYGSEGKYYYMRDSSVNDLVCAGETLTQIEKLSDLNEWCVYFDDKEYVATEQPYIATDDLVLYTKCLEPKYYATLDMNACAKYALFVNDKQIDLLETDLNYLGEEVPAGYFEQFRLVDDGILYDRNGEHFVLYNLETEKSITIGSAYLGAEVVNDAQIVDVDMSADKVGYVVRKSTWIGNGYMHSYTLHYGGKTYDDVYSFRLIDGDLYYVKQFLKKKMDYTSIYEASLIKNDLKIADFYVESSGFTDYDPFFIKKAPDCLPKTEVCIYDDENFTILSLDYDPYNENEYDIYSPVTLVNGKPVLSNELDSIFYVYPVIEDKVVRYLLLGDTFGNNYYLRSSDLDFDYKLYEGDYPMIVFKN